jgi:hypothetical protein
MRSTNIVRSTMRIPLRALLLALVMFPASVAAQKVEMKADSAAAVVDHDHDHDHDHGYDEDDRFESGLDLGVSVASNYNRVEGLPVMFGPILRAGETNRLELSGQAIWRTEPSASLGDDIGYRVRIDQGLFGDRVRVGGEAISWAPPIETHGLNSTEPGLAAALFHSDLHDYFEERAWGLHAELRPGDAPLEARIAFRRADHQLLAVSDPWTLFRNEERWRLQPVVAEGRVSTLSLRVALDTRDDEASATRGVLASLALERALDQDLAMPQVDFAGALSGGDTFEDFTLARVDLRTFQPVTEWSTLGLRVFGAGSIEESVLPPQYQRALGGIGSLPGFALFEGACGSRDLGVAVVTTDTAGAPVVSDQTMHAAYGCDRVLLGQLEYRGTFGRPSEEERTDGVHRHGRWRFKGEMTPPQWAFFVDAARGWAFADLGFARRSDTETMVDAGMGVMYGGAGVYAAVPVTGDDHELRVIVRLQHRF